MIEAILVTASVMAAFYVILLRPVINQQKRRKRDISKMSEGDEVLTTGGFFATVVEIRTMDEGPMQVLLEVADGVVLRGTPDAILEVTRSAEADSREPTDARSIGAGGETSNADHAMNE